MPRPISVRNVLGALLLAALPVGAVHGEQLQVFRIGSGFDGGVYYPVADVIGTAISQPADRRTCDATGGCGVPGLLAVAQTSNGSVSNINGLRQGALEAALVQADVADWAYNGRQLFQDQPALRNLRAIACLYPESLHIVARPGSAISDIADLRDRRISLDEDGSGTLIEARIVLAAHGLTENDLQAEYVKPAFALERMRAARLDGFMIMAGTPAASIAKAIALGATLVPIHPQVAAAIHGRYPYLTAGTIPADTYGALPETPTLQVYALLVTMEEISASLIYAVTAALWSERTHRMLQAGHPQARHILFETALTGISVPLHPGAEKYYRERGKLR